MCDIVLPFDLMNLIRVQVALERQMDQQEEGLLARIANLEHSTSTEGKSKNKKSK